MPRSASQDCVTLEERSVFFYDGDCGLCDATVAFLIRHSPSHALQFCALQSDTAGHFFKKIHGRSPDLSTAYLYHQGIFHNKSSAVLHALSLCEGKTKQLSILLIIPKVIRDGIYTFNASIRKYLPFSGGQCSLLSADEKARFVCQ